MWFYHRILRVLLTKHTSKEKILMRTRTRRKLLLMLRRKQMGCIMRQEGLENLKLIGRNKSKGFSGQQQINYKTGLKEWIREQRQEDQHKEKSHLIIITRQLMKSLTKEIDFSPNLWFSKVSYDCILRDLII